MKTLAQIRHIDLSEIGGNAHPIIAHLRTLYELKEGAVYRNALCDDPATVDDPFPSPYIVDVGVLLVAEGSDLKDDDAAAVAAKDLRWALDSGFPGWSRCGFLLIEIT